MDRRGKASVVFLCILWGSAYSAFGGNVDPETVRAALLRSPHSNSEAQQSAAATKTSPLQAFAILGSGTQTNSSNGTCSGAACASSAGDCMCLTYAGTQTSKNVGNGSWTAMVTVNVDDCTNTGTPNGFCCVGDGVVLASDSAKTPDTLSMSITGSVCDDPNADDDDGVSATYIILNSSNSGSVSTGKFANSAGTGQLNIFSIDVNQPAYMSAEGSFQLDSPL